jgi:hypothetical protein
VLFQKEDYEHGDFVTIWDPWKQEEAAKHLCSQVVFLFGSHCRVSVYIIDGRPRPRCPHSSLTSHFPFLLPHTSSAFMPYTSRYHLKTHCSHHLHSWEISRQICYLQNSYLQGFQGPHQIPICSVATVITVFLMLQ